MEILRLTKNKIDLKQWDKQYASPAHCTKVIEDDTIVYLNGSDVPAIIYLRDAVTIPPGLVTNLKVSKFGTQTRQSGIAPKNLTFGYTPRNPVYTRENCQATRMTNDSPELMAKLAALGTELDALYKERNPVIYAKHSQQTSEVLSDWRISGTVFTSGVVNKNSQLPYHYDRGNFKEAWSAMVTLRNGITGGYLACPEIDTLIKNTNGSLLLFDGQSLLHGVTPIGYSTTSAYRYTIVYYSLAKMWQCLAPLEELKRANKVRAGREIRRANEMRNNG
jgi:hypothetical protein